MRKDAPSPFTNYHDAAEAVVSAFISENVGSPNQERIRRELMQQVLPALEMDGKLPNDYEVEALNGCVPEDGSDDEDANHGCPDWVSAKFPNTDAVIAAQF